MRILLGIYALLLFCCNATALAKPPQHYNQSKKIVMHLFHNHQETLYCGCTYDEKKVIHLKSCNMHSAQKIARAHRLEFEHMMAAEHFGQHFKCWREAICHDRRGKAFKGRKCCQRIDAKYRQAEAELYNLWPAVGLVNQARSNYRFSPLPKTNSFYGCAIIIDSKLRKVEPPHRAKGTVARAHLFMAMHYNIRLSAAQQNLFNVWNHQYPPTDWEKEWALKVAKIEGYSNPYIDSWDKVAIPTD